MTPIRIALAHLPFPASPADSVTRAASAIRQAAAQGASIICFPECYVPGYRAPERGVAPPDADFLESAFQTLAHTAASARIAVILGTERLAGGEVLPRATALVIQPDGTRGGFQDKVQIDPSEESTYAPGSERRIFETGPLRFGIVICHEGWRYPETVRWAVRCGAHIVFHPQFHAALPGDPLDTFHRHAVACRAAENTCYFATVNYASPAAPTTTAIAAPDGTLLAEQPIAQEGLLIADLDLDRATGLLAARYRPL